MIDFADGVPLLASHFRSVLFLLQADGDDFSVPTDRLVTWIEELNAWYLEVTGIARGRNLHLAYHRSIELVAPRLLRFADKIERLGTSCRALGYGFAITVQVGEALAHRADLERLVEVGALHHLGINLVDVESGAEDAARDLVEALACTSVQLALLGSLAVQRRLGLLSSPKVNRADITLYPANVTPGSIDDGAEIRQPCANRFRLYVQADGELFPCLGLVGHPRASLGSIYRPISETALYRRPYALPLARLALTGPSEEELSAPVDDTMGLPVACARHRAALESSS
ncbi:MAG TPA: hypothetical protein VIK91_17830 [Nannocystis sp.]